MKKERGGLKVVQGKYRFIKPHEFDFDSDDDKKKKPNNEESDTSSNWSGPKDVEVS